MTTDIWQQLRAEFPQQSVHWRGQTVTKNGDKALALAYVDARDVMERLDAVLGPENWSDQYEVSGSRTLCRLSIRHDGQEWITKCDGAGDTDYEAEKGSISDAFKRAAVKFGVARYLYDLPAPWVPCETFEKNGKKVFKKFTDNPWNYVRKQGNNGQRQPTPQPESVSDQFVADTCESLHACETLNALKQAWESFYKNHSNALTSEQYKHVEQAKDQRKHELNQQPMETA